MLKITNNKNSFNALTRTKFILLTLVNVSLSFLRGKKKNDNQCFFKKN